MNFQRLTLCTGIALLPFSHHIHADSLDIGVGTNGNGTFVPAQEGHALVRHPGTARKLWESGTSMGYQKSMLKAAGVFYGGVAGVIAADGIVVGNYYRPSGEVLNAVTETRYYSLEDQQRLGDALRKIDADDVTVAYDAETGDTLWSAEEIGKGMNFLSDKRGHYGITPAYGGGAVFVWGALGNVYAYDAQTGVKRWETAIQPFHDTATAMKATAITNRALLPVASKSAMGMFYNFRSGLVYLDGKVIVPNGFGGLVALDAQTGNKLWNTPNDYSSTMATPAIPVIEDKAYLLIADEGKSPGLVSTVRLLSPEDGSVIWAYAAGGANYTSLVVQGDKALINTRGRDQLGGETLTLAERHGLFSGFRLTLQGPEQLWTLEDVPHHWHIISPDRGWNRRAAIRDGLAYLLLGSKDVNVAMGQRPYDQQLYVVDMETGEVLFRSLEHFPGVVTNPYIIEQSLVLWTDLAHSWPANGFQLYDLSHNPSQPQFRGTAMLSSFGINAPTGYLVGHEYPFVSGRFFMKSINGMAALDLRENRAASQPFADIQVTAGPALEATPVQFNSAASSVAEDRSIIAYVWNFGDGAIAQEPNPTHTFATSGYFNVSLKVIDSSGAADTTWYDIIVSGQTPRPPYRLKTAARSDSAIELSWINRAPHVDAFQVEFRAEGSDTWQTTPSIDASRTLYEGEASTLLTGLNPSTTYEIRVRSVLDGNASPPSQTVTKSTLVELIAIYLEAECVAEFDANFWKLVAEDAVSNGLYLEALVRDSSLPPAPARVLAFPFDVPFSSTYYTYARAYGQSGANDSLFYAFNDEPFNPFGFCCTEWIWSTQIPSRRLEAGSHVLHIASREQGARLDKIVITNSHNAPTDIGPIGANCSVGIVSPISLNRVFADDTFLTVEFIAEVGKSYAAMRAASLQSEDWSPTGSNVLDSEGGLESISMPLGQGPHLFVRIQEINPQIP